MRDPFINSFKNARNTDTNHAAIDKTQYVEAHNLELIGENSFYSLRNIKGTTTFHNIALGNDQETMAVYATKWKIGGVSKDCLTIFIYVGQTRSLIVGVLDLATNDFYQPFTEVQPVGYYSADRVIDAVNFPENDVDVIYFTDFYNEIRFIKCENPSTTLSSYDVSLQRRGANGTIALTSILTGGSLLSGTYQFSYRMGDPENKKFTKWSTLTNPIHVYTVDNSNSPVYSGIGLTTPRKITLSITPATEETTEYDFIQLAVVENVGPTVSDIDGVTSALPTTASLLEWTSIPGTSLTFAYTSNSKVGSIPISDITTDLAAIKKVKTLNVKENRLIVGNIHYTALEFDNGTPTVTSGSIATQTLATKDAYSSDDFASRYVGYWRDEVYRFGIVYYDEYGNKSSVQPLNLTNKITGNQSNTICDVRFPTRSTSNSYAIFNSSNEIRALGLQLNGIINHPTWARAFEIVRVKRKKNILFQTPIIPMVSVEGIGALDAYPTLYDNGSSDGSVNTVEGAQPQTANKVLIPKNLFRPDPRTIVKRSQTVGSGDLLAKIGEATYGLSTSGFTYSMIFPSPSMYGDSTFVYTGSEKIDFVDYALVKLNLVNNNSSVTKTPAVVAGDDINTNLSGNFYALNEGQYYFDSTWVGKSIDSRYQNVPIVGYEFFDNFGQPASVSGFSTLDYDALDTKGIKYGFKPSILKSAVIKLSSSQPIPDIAHRAVTTPFKAATLNAYTSNGYVTSQNQIRYENESTRTNGYVIDYAGFDGTNYSTYTGAIGIANVKHGLGNDRYGDINAFHEYISTGAKYTFSTSEIATLEAGGSVSKNITVWGGDCFIGPQTFKVCDSAYSIVDQQKNNQVFVSDATMISKWGFVFVNTEGGIITMPVAVENASQFVEVILESDYSEVRDTDTVTSTTSDSGMPVYNVRAKEEMRVPLSYKYNLNLSKQNDRKIFVPKPLYSFEQNEFGARLAYSDKKIYNSDQAGFDIFRVGDIYDLEESRRNITKLALAGDKLYAIQEQGVVYIPTGENQVEQTNAGTLAIRSGDVIGRPLVIDTVRGSQHLKGIVETGDIIFVPDNINKSVYVLAGQELKPIIENNESQFRTFFENLLDEKNVVGIYNPVRREYWLVDNSNNKCEVFREGLGWVGNYEFTDLQGGVHTDSNLYVLSPTVVYTMYTGEVNQLFGTTVTPRVKFIVNPDGNTSKTFDNISIAASSALDTVDYITEGTTSQTVNGTSINITPREGKYVTHVPRDGSNGRLRGLRMAVTLKWRAAQSAVSDFATRYRLSSRR